MVVSNLESSIAKRSSLLQRIEGISLRVAIDRVLQGFNVAPEDRRDLYRAVERRVAQHEKKVKLVNDLVEATSKLYNDKRHPIGMPDAMEVALTQAGIQDREERAWFRERVGRRLQARSAAKRRANLRDGRRSKGKHSNVLQPAGQRRLPLRAPRFGDKR